MRRTRSQASSSKLQLLAQPTVDRICQIPLRSLLEYDEATFVILQKEIWGHTSRMP